MALLQEDDTIASRTRYFESRTKATTTGYNYVIKAMAGELKLDSSSINSEPQLWGEMIKVVGDLAHKCIKSEKQVDCVNLYGLLIDAGNEATPSIATPFLLTLDFVNKTNQMLKGDKLLLGEALERISELVYIVSISFPCIVLWIYARCSHSYLDNFQKGGGGRAQTNSFSAGGLRANICLHVELQNLFCSLDKIGGLE